MTRRFRVLVLVLAVLGGASLAMFAVALRAELRHRDHHAVAPPELRTASTRDDTNERDALLSTVARGLHAVWIVDYSFARTLANGRSISADETVANRPPDRVAAGLGGISGVRNGHQITCGELDGKQVCAPSGPAQSFDDIVKDKVANLRDALAPPNHWYRVTRGHAKTIAGQRATCFVLTRIVIVPAPPYGERSVLCFGVDGVPLLDRVERVEGTDDRMATAVHHSVTDADLDRILNSS